MANSGHILTPEEVDSLLRYPRGRAARLARAGKLPVIILRDGELRFSRDSILDALARMSRPAEGRPQAK